MVFITRQQALQLIDTKVLQNMQAKWNLKSCKITSQPHHVGGQNLIYYLTNGNTEYVLRISIREDRSLHQIQAEVHFVNYLHNNGALVAYPLKSENNLFVEPIEVAGFTFYCVLFNKAKGFRLPDKNYKYREGASIGEYCHNYGKTLGAMHRLTKNYVPISNKIIRFNFLDNMNNILIPKYLPNNQDIIKSKFNTLIKKVRELPKDKDSYGLIHADFNDGNLVVDYDNGNITTFDFDDSSYCWFMYEIAAAWTQGFGWAMFADTIEKRKSTMDKWFNKVMDGYFTENAISDTWLKKLPFFLKLVEMEWVICLFEEVVVNNEEIDEELLFKLECVKKDIPYLGMFDKIYNHKHPFCLIQ